ncbi:putative heat-labile enterotoxin [Ophiocordyceps camponoti-saundersi (nom. inval.)]|nr:putative heat-labile enterotoxin [Ophiocordyceps camponoti-saundersi (nom. inval.)]
MNRHVGYPWLWIALAAIVLSSSVNGNHQPGIFWASEHTQNLRRLAATQPEILWRGELTRTPDDVQSVGGLYAEGFERLAKNGSISERQLSDGCSLFLHAQRLVPGYSQYISTCVDPYSATHLEALERNITEPIEDYVLYLYKIHIDQSMFQVNLSLGRHYNFPTEPEWAAVGFIPWKQVMGYYKFKLTGLSSVFDMEYKVKKNAQFFINPQYDAIRYDEQRGAGPQPQLAGFPSNSPAWTEKPWKAFKHLDITQLIGQFVWHRVCARDYACYRKRRPILRSSSLSVSANSAEHKKEEAAVRKDPPRVLFFSHFLWPAEAKRQHGFLTAADLAFSNDAAPAEAYTLQHHLDIYNLRRSSFFLQGSENLGTAAEWAAKAARKYTTGFDGVVYAVHATPNMIDIGLTRGHHYGRMNPMAQRFAIAGGIKWTQVQGWIQVPENYSRTPASDIGTEADVRGHFQRAFDEKTHLFQRNPDYDKDFDQFTANDRPQMQLFTSSQPKKALKEFMNQYANVLGWTGDFPLFRAPQITTARQSARAKAAQIVPKPHPEGVAEKIHDFISRHPVAMSVLPQAATMAMIPGFMVFGATAELVETAVAAVKSSGWAVEILVGIAEFGAAGAIVAGAHHVREALDAADSLEGIEDVLESL